MEKQKRTPRQKGIFIFKIIGGVVLVPILFAAFTVDRIILIFLPWKNGESVQLTFRDLKYFVPIMYRVGFISLIIILKLIVELIF